MSPLIVCSHFLFFIETPRPVLFSLALVPVFPSPLFSSAPVSRKKQRHGSRGTRPCPRPWRRPAASVFQRRDGRGDAGERRGRGLARAGEALVRARGQVCVLEARRPRRGTRRLGSWESEGLRRRKQKGAHRSFGASADVFFFFSKAEQESSIASTPRPPRLRLDSAPAELWKASTRVSSTASRLNSLESKPPEGMKRATFRRGRTRARLLVGRRDERGGEIERALQNFLVALSLSLPFFFITLPSPQTLSPAMGGGRGRTTRNSK